MFIYLKTTNKEISPAKKKYISMKIIKEIN